MTVPSGDMIQVTVRGADKIAREFARKAATIDGRVQRCVRMHGQLLKTSIQAHASGRPGPNAPTGDYRRSWTVEVGGAGGEHTAIIGTAKPQGRRLEYGFVGVDSLGRHYHQPPYPHVRPAIATTEPAFLHDLELIAVT